MAQSKHTPGPTGGKWHYENGAVYAEIETVDGSKVYPTICTVDARTTACHRNGQFIAVAPLMLAALREIVADYDSRIPRERQSPVIKTTRAVIRAATGEE